MPYEEFLQARYRSADLKDFCPPTLVQTPECRIKGTYMFMRKVALSFDLFITGQALFDRIDDRDIHDSYRGLNLKKIHILDEMFIYMYSYS